jgi:hypothetical protein
MANAPNQNPITLDTVMASSFKSCQRWFAIHAAHQQDHLAQSSNGFTPIWTSTLQQRSLEI